MFDIYEDAKGRIWFGTLTGEAFILEGDTVKPYPFNHLIAPYRGKFHKASLGYLEPEQEKVYIKMDRLGVLVIDSMGRDSLITPNFPYGYMGYKVGEGSRTIVTQIYNPDEKAYYYWLNLALKSRIFKVAFVSEKGYFEKELNTNPGKLDKGWEIEKLRNGYLLIALRNRLFCLKGGDVLWFRPLEYDIGEIVEDEKGAVWICGIFGSGLRYFRNLEALETLS